MASLVSQTVKNPPAIQETRVQFLGQEDPLEKGMAAHSSILAWRIPWIEEPGGVQSMGLQRIGHDWLTNTCIVGIGGYGGWDMLFFAICKVQNQENWLYNSDQIGIPELMV